MLTPSIEDISVIIDKLKELKSQKEELKYKKFLTPVQQEVFNAQNKPLWLYIWKLPDDIEREHFSDCNIPICYKPSKYGRLVLVDDKELKLYSENENGVPKHKGVRMDLDEDMLIQVLKAKIRKERQLYWSENVEPLINKIEILLYPWWNYFGAKGSWGTREQEIIEAALKSPEVKDLKKVVKELERIKYNLEVEARQSADKGNIQAKKKRKAKVKKPERKFKPWTKPGDACFVIICTTEGDWTKGIHFHHDGKHENLRLRSGSRTETLLTQLKGQYLSPEIIKANIGKDRTKASDIVTYANGLLNEKIRGTGFTVLPDHDVAFVVLQSGRYKCEIRIYTKDEFDHEEIKKVTR